VPFVFTLSPEGLGVLLRAPFRDIVSASGTAAVGVAALAAGLGGWLRGPVSPPLRAALTGAGVLLFYAAPWADLVGLTIIAVVLILQLRRQPPTAGTSSGG
jgi:TRAP-type uncharacterized transport system fused permease subunit